MPEDTRIQELLQWAKQNGSVIDPSIEFKATTDKGVSVYSTKTFHEPSSVPQIKIPVDIVIRNELAEGYFGPEFVSKGDNVNSALKLLVARLKFENSITIVDDIGLKAKFAPFIDLLPVGRETGSVHYWTSEELQLLANTNLGSSLGVKTDALIKEWYNTVKNREETPQLVQDLKFNDIYHSLSRDEFVASILDVGSWTSFGAYLWASIIFTSRAFPHEIIDKNCKPGQAILLPVIDLLNHDNSASVEWTLEKGTDKDYFSLLNKDLNQEGAEIFNNYGAKGNEELLLGYGFAIKSNKSDNVALKVKLPAPIAKGAESFGFKVPRIEDYTHFAFTSGGETKAAKRDYDEDEGMLFYINFHNLQPENLLLLFQYLSKAEHESKPTLRTKFEALQRLRGALEHKSALLKQRVTCSEDILPSIVQNTTNYREGQKEIYKRSLSAIKHTEKQLLGDHKSHVTTLKKIYKRDEALSVLAGDALGRSSYEDIEAEDMADQVLFLWVISHGQGIPTDYKPFSSILESYRKAQSTPDTELVANFTDASAFLQEQMSDKEIGKHLTAENLAAASQAIKDNAYIRISNDEIILVHPLEI